MDKKLVGDWGGDAGGSLVEIFFYSDGTFETNILLGGGDENFGVWKTKGDELLLTFEAGMLGFRYRINANSLVLTNVKTGGSMELSKYS